MLNIKLTMLSTKKLGNLAEQTIILSERNSSFEVSNHPLLQVLKESFTAYHTNIIKERYSGMGNIVAEADLKRDNCHSGLNRLLRGFFAFGEDTEKGQAARQLLALFKETGKITRLGYAEENVVIENLLEKLATPEAQENIARLGLSMEVEQLMMAQSAFMELYRSQIDANSQLRQQPSATSLRRGLSVALRNYYGYVSAIAGVEPWKDIYADLKELIKKSK